MSSEFTIRPMTKADEPFVYRAWLEGAWPHNGGPVIMAKHEWLPRWHALIERLLATGGAQVAHLEGKPESLLGFAASGHGCLHWAYTKQAFRGLGIATEMIRKFNFNSINGNVCSHWTPKLEEHGWRYDPRFLRGHP